MSIYKRIIVFSVSWLVAVVPAFPALAAFHEGLRQGLQERRQNIQSERQEGREAVQERREAVQNQRQERRENVEAKVQERRENIQEKRQELRQRLAEKRKHLIREFFNRMVKRLEAALERQKKLADRIQSRIERARANGRDVVQAQAALDRAKALWPEAKAALEEAKGKLEGALNAETPGQAFEEVRALIHAARDKIKAVHAALVDAITSLKGIGAGERRGQTPATTTP